MEVLQTSPLATWVRRRCSRSRPSIARSRPRCLARGTPGGRNLAARLGGLVLATLLFLLLALLERLHATLRFAPLTDVALEGPSTCHDVTSGGEERRTYPGVPWTSRHDRLH